MKIYLLVIFALSFNAYGQTKKEPLFSREELKHPLEVKTLDLSNNYWLMKLPQKLKKFKNLEEIDISSNPMLDLIESFELLSKFKKLKSLRLSRVNDSIINKISTPKVLNMFKKLKSLSIGRVSDSILNKILPLTSIEELNISGNGLTSIPEVVKKLPLLRKLLLSDNKISKTSLLPGDFFNLEEIDLGANKLTEFPDDLSLIPSLKIISVDNNLISAISPSIKKLLLLENLDMSNNKIYELPKEFRELKKLKILQLWKNQLTSITPLLNLEELQELDVSYNKIEEVSEEIGMLTNLIKLRKLDLHENSISSISALFNLTSLEELRLTNNKIEELSDKISKLKNLKDLSLSGNPISEVQEQIANLQALTYISINAIDSTKLPKYLSLLATLPKLKTLSIEMNGIQKMPVEFKKLTQVNRFIISDCKLIRQERKRIKSLFPNASYSFYKSWGDSCFYKDKPCSMDENSWDTISVNNLNLKYLFVKQWYIFTDSDDIHHWRGEVLLNLDKISVGKETLEKILITIADRLQLEEIIAARTCITFGIMRRAIPPNEEEKNYYNENFIGSYSKSLGLKRY